MEMLNKKLTIYLIGEGSLLINCADFLIENNHIILGIITEDPNVQKWVNNKNISILNDFKAVSPLFFTEPFDLLLSIHNPLILKKEILDLPQKYAINYHDSLLPTYAGINATSWAIINGEKKHGISWHTMTQEIDEGLLLDQVQIEITPNMTSESLNLRCFQEAYHSFCKIITNIVSQNEILIPMNLKNKTIFKKHVLPEDSSLLNFNRPSSTIIRLHQGLSFGAFDNPINIPKLYINGSFYIPNVITGTDTNSCGLPGQIVKVDSSYVEVQTVDKNIRISSITTLTGKQLKIDNLFPNKKKNINITPPQTLVDNLDSSYSNLYDQEYLSYYSSFTNTEFPFYKNKKTQQSIAPNTTITKDNLIISDIQALPTSIVDQAYWKYTLFTFMNYLTRITLSEKASVSFVPLEFPLYQKQFGNLYIPTLPLTISINEDGYMSDEYQIFSKHTKTFFKTPPVSQDFFQRYHATCKELDIDLNSINSPLVFIVDDILQLPIVDEFMSIENHDISLYIEKSGLYFGISSHPSLYDKETLTRILASFQVFYNEGITTEKTIKTLSLVTPSEKELLLGKFKGYTTSIPTTCIHEMVNSFAKTTPDATALVFLEQKITYEQLHHYSNQLAHYLLKAGIKAGDIVGILLDRSIEMIIAILGILKVRGTYVPIDINYPKERIDFIIKDIQMTHCVTLKKHQSIVEGDVENLVSIDLADSVIYFEKRTNPNILYSIDDLAYIIYTSGSTGKPKGVTINHKNLLGLIIGCEGLVKNEYKKVGTLVSTFSFDTSLWEIFTMLCYGRELHIITLDCYTNGEAFATYLIENKVTTTYMIPSLVLDTLYYLEKNKEKCALQYFKTGLEPKKQNILQAIRDVFPNMVIANAYGPTETTVCGTFYYFTTSDDLESYTSIGKPMPNYETYIADKNQQLMPITVPGELFIGGLCTSNGYYKRPELTSQRFIKNSFNLASTYPLYITGDTVRYEVDGNIDFIGRKDNQVKISGYRVELGEIESILAAHPIVKNVVVTVYKGKDDHNLLVGYVLVNKISEDFKSIAVEVLKDNILQYLQEQLPAYMIPNEIILLDTFPLLLNGKINKKALPVPKCNIAIHKYVAPTTTLQRELVTLFQEVFYNKKIGVADNFFDLGGYSLLAAKLFNKINLKLNIKIPLSTIYEAPTILLLEASIIKNAKHHTWSNIITMKKGTKPPLFLLHTINGSTFIYDTLVQSFKDDYQIYGIQITHDDEEKDIIKLASFYREQIQELQPSGPYLFCGYSYGGLLAYEIAAQLNEQKINVDFLGLIDTYTPGGNELYGKTKKEIIEDLFKRFIQKGPITMINHFRKSFKNRVYRTYNISGNYYPREYTGELTLFICTQKFSIKNTFKKDLGWSDFAKGYITICNIACNHFEIFESAYISEISSVIMEKINEL